MKTFKLFNLNRKSSAMVQADGCTAARQKIGVNPRTTSTIGRFASVLCIILIMLLTLGVGQMWGMTFGASTIYFDNTDANFTNPCLYIWSGEYNETWQMTKVSGSDCYWTYTRSSDFGGDGFLFKDKDTWTGQSSNITDSYNSGWWTNCYSKESGWKIVGPKSMSKSNTTETEAGSGTSGSKYIVKEGTKITVSASGTKIDANHTVEYKFNDGSWSTTNTYTVVNSAVAATDYSVTVYVRTKRGDLTSREFNLGTIYYRGETKYNVKAVASPVAGGSVTPTSNTAMGQYTGGTITASENTGYTFTGWTGGTGTYADASEETTTFKPTAASTVTANFSENMSTVTLTASPSGKGTFQVGGATVTSTTAGVTTTRSVTAVPISGYRFSSWSISGGATISSTSTNPTTVTGGGAGTAATLTATFEEDLTYYKLKFGARSGETSYGSVAAEDGSGNTLTSNTDYLSGTSVTVTATATDDDYKFDCWYNAWTSGSSVSTDNPLTFTLTAATDRYAHFVQKTTTVTINANGGSGGSTDFTATHGSTLPSFTMPARSGYTLTGLWTESSGGTKIVNADKTLVASVTDYTTSEKKWDYDDATLTLYAQWTENMTTVTVNVSPTGTGTLTVGGDAFTPGNTTTAGKTTSRTVVATAQPGYKFSSWSASGNATGTSSTNTYTLKGNGSAGTGTLTANFDRLYAYVEGRFQVKNAARSSTTTTYTSGGQWNESSTNIQMEYDNTNHRFALHTHMTPSELTATHGTGCDDCNPYFYIKTSTSNSSLAGVTSYMCTSAQTLTTAGSANGKTVSSSSGSNSNLRFNSSTASGYAVIYFNQSKIWYELEQRLQYNGNGNTGGSAPTGTYGNNTYHSTNASITTPANTFTKTGYHFIGWKVGNAGDLISAGSSVTMNADKTLYAQWEADTYTNVTIDDNGGSADGKYSVTYYATSLTVTTAPTKTGYQPEGYYKEAGTTTKVANADGTLNASKTYTDASKHWISTSSPTLYTKWTAKQYNITLDKKEGATGGTAKVKYDATSLTNISAPTRTGYHVEGYYGETGRTNKVAASDGTLQSGITGFTTGTAWTKDGDATLFTKWTPNTYTIAFNANDANYLGTATGSTTSMTGVEYDEEVELTANGFSRAHYTFAGWATTPTGAVAYSNGQEVSNLSSTNGATVTLYAKWTGDTYTVSFNKGAGTCATSSTTVHYGSTYGEGSGLDGEMPAVGAPAGYVFSGWYDAPAGGRKIEKDSVVTATTDHTLYARYTKRDRVYFYNNLGWSDVYVTYDAYWDNDKGTGNYKKIYHHMTQIGSSNIWYDDIPSSVLSSWKFFIAFNNTKLLDSPLDVPTESGNYGNYNSGKAVYRHDFDSYATMFVPYSGADSWTKNGGTCTYQSSSWTHDDAEGIHGENYRHSTGYWVRYNETKCGYAITGTWDSWANTTDFQAENAGDDTYTVTKTLAANTTYDFLLYKDYSTNSYNHIFTYTTETITSGSCTDKSLTTNGTKYSELETHHTQITTTAAGEYVFKLTPGTDGVLKLSVEYPFAVNDYRVTYNWNDGSPHSHSSEIIKKAASTTDTISVFVHKATNVTSQSLKIEKCTNISAGVATWTAGNTIALPTEEITANGVYNFIITQPASGEPTGAFWNKYDGNYYIRTESSDGGWNYYKDYEDNIMTYSDYSLTQTLSDPYSHYYCRYIENCGMDITYQIATDYSSCVSDVFVGDATIGAGNKTLPSGNPASIRFSWNEQTNAMRRAYLKSAQGAGNKRYLVLHGQSDDMIFDKDGNAIVAEGAGADDLKANELLFTDNGNWVYQISLQVKPGANVSLIAKYNGSDRYLVGNGSDKWLTILGGEGSSKYDIAAVYDFKTNRLMTAWTPSGAISDKLKDVDLMLIRHAQEAATSVTFSGSGSLDAKKVIGALRMDYNELFGHVAGWTSSSRPLLKFFISFPFDVYVSDVFGLNSAYGDAYVIQRYAGDERAAKGFFRGDGTTSFWTDLTISDTLHANVGYCVILDNDYFNGDLGSIWQNKSAGSSVYLYFPSAGDVGNIESNEKTITIPPHECTINRTFGSGKNHKNTDSHWNLMGVPIFNDHTGSSAAGTPGAIFVTTGDQDKDCHYFYEWNSSNNQFSIRAALGYVFKSMHSYMVQYTGDVTFTGSAIVPASIAARSMPTNENYNIELQVLNSNAEMLNRTYIELREEACDTFALNEDVYMSTNTNAVNIYTFAGNYDVAANVLSVKNHSIPVGLNVRTAGTYTITMPNAFSGTAVLLDKQTGVRTNLAISNYEVELPKEVIDDRFVLEIDGLNNVITDIEFTTGEGSLKDGKAHKFVQDGILYIIQNGVIYDAQGKRVQ